MIYIKSHNDIQLIKHAANIWKKVRDALIQACKVGVKLIDLDELAAKVIIDNGATCSFYLYNGFPKHICISVNEQIIHGIPNDYVIKSDDLVSFDVGVTYQNHVCDAAFSVHVNPRSELVIRINEVTKQSLMEAIKQVKPHNRVGDISYAIQTYVRQNGFEVIENFGGHGCGIKLHEDPMILNYGKPHQGAELLENMTLCIEPMVLVDTSKYFIDKKNNWTVISKNKKITCHWEHMVLVTHDGCEILTGE